MRPSQPSQKLLKNAECKEMQLGEFDVLQAIYGETKIVDMRQKQAWKVFQPIEMKISLIPSAGDSHGEMFVGVDLYVKCTSDYPNVPPHIELKNPTGIGEHLVRRFTENLKDRAKNYVGKEMILDLCSDVQSFLHGHNRPPLLMESCCHDEMMKTINQKAKQKEDERRKLLEEQKNIEKLQAETIRFELKKKREELKKEKKKKNDMDLRTSLDIKEDIITAVNIAPDDDSEEEEEDLRISVSEVDADYRLQSDYTVLEKLGHGAFGDVVKVQNLLDGRFYAIKRIPLNFKKNKTKRITQEVKLLSRLNHKNVVRYYTSWIEASSKSSQFANRKPSDASSDKHESSSSSTSDSDGSLDSLHDESTDDIADKSSSIMFQASNSNVDNYGDDDSNLDYSNESKMPSLSNQFLYIQMEFCDKSTLRDCIDKGMYKDKQLVWLLFSEIVEGLTHIHDQGIIHRDLKPVNIFLDSENHVKIGDFGLATVAPKNNLQEPLPLDVYSSTEDSCHNEDESLTSNVGTALYVSPEMLNRKQPYNQKVDLYSLGIIFFEMCYRPLDTGMERCKVLGSVRLPSIKFPDDFDSIVQSSQKEVLLWLLNHDPLLRPSTKELLSSELFPLLPSERSKVEKTLMSAVKNVNGHEHQLLMSTLFSQETTKAVDYSYDFTKESDFTEIHEVTLVRQYVVDVLAKIFRSHGAVCYDVPSLMPHARNIYPASCGEVLFVNKSGTIVSLPYDSRVNFARYVMKRNINNTKRFLIGKVYREFTIPELHPKELWECSFDVVSSSSCLNLNFDAEVIMIIQEIFNEFPGFSDKEFQLKFNHINFITAIMSYCQIPKDLHHEILLIFKECKDINHQKSRLMTKFSNLGFRESNIKRFFALIQKEDSFTGISNYLRSLPKAKDSELALIGRGLEYFKNLLEMLEIGNSKFQVVFSMKLCNNFHIYSGVSFQISRRCNKRMDVLATGGSYDALFDHFRQLDGRCQDTRHGVGVSASLEKIISSVRESQTLKEGKNFVPSVVELLVSSAQPKKHASEMFQLTQMLWNLGISCKLFDGHDNTLQLLKNFCKTNHIPFLVIFDSQYTLIKIDSSDKDSVLCKERNFTKFADFLKKKMSKESTDLNISRGGSIDYADISFNLTENNNRCTYEVKLVGSTGKYKDTSKVLANLGDVLEKFSNTHITIFILETPKELLKSIFAHIKLKDEASFLASMTSVFKECPRHKKYIQKLIDDVTPKRFRNNRHPVMILYNIEDDFHKVLI